MAAVMKMVMVLILGISTTWLLSCMANMTYLLPCMALPVAGYLPTT
jgi:hypothetical protein